MTEREPGVWRLRVMVDGKQVQRTFRGTKAARTRLRTRSWTSPTLVTLVTLVTNQGDNGG
jgi:hypothetical protein